MSYPVLVCQAALAATFVASVVVKVRSHSAYADFRRSLRASGLVPARLAGHVASAVATAEATVALALVAGAASPLSPPGSAWRVLAPIGFALAAGLLAAFTAALVAMIDRGVATGCRCFGAGARPPGGLDLTRNVVLLAVAVTGLALTTAIASDPDLGGWMPYVIAAVLLVGALGGLNAALGLTNLRRLREQNELLVQVLKNANDHVPVMLEKGETVGDFVTTTVDGEPLSRADLTGDTLVGFISPNCPACAESLPTFIDRAGSIVGGRDRVLAVVLGGAEETVELADRLAPVARVVAEEGLGPVAQAFRVDSYPAYALLAGDSVVASHFILDRLPDAVAA